MSVTVGISKRSDFTLDNAGYRLLLEMAYPRAKDEGDRRILNAAMWTHFLDLTHLDREQGRRIAWLLDGAAQARIDQWQAGHPDTGSADAETYESLQSLLRDTFDREPVVQVVDIEQPAELSDLVADPALAAEPPDDPDPSDGPDKPGGPESIEDSVAEEDPKAGVPADERALPAAVSPEEPIEI